MQEISFDDDFAGDETMAYLVSNGIEGHWKMGTAMSVVLLDGDLVADW